jgi:hypothetical protein
MSEYRFEPGVHFIQQNREFAIEQYLTDEDLQVKDVVTNEFTSKPLNSLLDAWVDGSLELLGNNENYQSLQNRRNCSATKLTCNK